MVLDSHKEPQFSHDNGLPRVVPLLWSALMHALPRPQPQTLPCFLPMLRSEHASDLRLLHYLDEIVNRSMELSQCDNTRTSVGELCLYTCSANFVCNCLHDTAHSALSLFALSNANHMLRVTSVTVIYPEHTSCTTYTTDYLQAALSVRLTVQFQPCRYCEGKLLC